MARVEIAARRTRSALFKSSALKCGHFNAPGLNKAGRSAGPSIAQLRAGPHRGTELKQKRYFVVVSSATTPETRRSPTLGLL